MTPTHIMLTEQGFVALEMPNEKDFSGDQWKENDAYKRAVKNGIPFAEEEHNIVHSFVWNNNNGLLPYALPDGVEVEIKELCGHTNRECGDSCDDCNKFPYKRAYLKTKEVKEEGYKESISPDWQGDPDDPARWKGW